LSQSFFLHMQDPFLKRSLAPPRLQGCQSSSRPYTDCTDLVPSRPMPMCFRRRGKPGARSQEQPKAKSQKPEFPATLSCNTWPDHETGYWKAEARVVASLFDCRAVPPASADCSENRLGLLGPRLAFGHRQVGVQLACRNLAAQSPSSVPWSS
jgi:hypothetical protein